MGSNHRGVSGLYVFHGRTAGVSELRLMVARLVQQRAQANVMRSHMGNVQQAPNTCRRPENFT